MHWLFLQIYYQVQSIRWIRISHLYHYPNLSTPSESSLGRCLYIRTDIQISIEIFNQTLTIHQIPPPNLCILDLFLVLKPTCRNLYELNILEMPGLEHSINNILDIRSIRSGYMTLTFHRRHWIWTECLYKFSLNMTYTPLPPAW